MLMKFRDKLLMVILDYLLKLHYQVQKELA